MKSFISICVLTFLFSSQTSHAFLLTLAGSHNRHSITPIGVLGCLALLPLCLLDAEGDAQPGEVGREFLSENGYSDSDIAVLLEDQRKLEEALTRLNAKIEIQATDSLEEIRVGLQQIVPEISELYVQFLQEFTAE